MGESVSAELIGLGVLALLVFWSVGAYNRLVRLRNAASSAWRLVDELLTERVRLLEQFAVSLRESRPALRPVVEAALAAARQASTACDAARERPLVARHLHGVSIALQVLQSNMAAWPAQLAAAAAESEPPRATTSDAGLPVDAPAAYATPFDASNGTSNGDSNPGDATPADANAGDANAGDASPGDASPDEPDPPAAPPAPAQVPADSQAQAQTQAPATAGLPFEAWAAQSARLEFAARQFNAAVQAYNDAALQIPTRVVSTLFGLRPARTLDLARQDGPAG